MKDLFCYMQRVSFHDRMDDIRIAKKFQQKKSNIFLGNERARKYF